MCGCIYNVNTLSIFYLLFESIVIIRVPPEEMRKCSVYITAV